MPADPSVQHRSAIVWFRDDLRVADHPALTAAVDSGRPVVCVYCFDQVSADVRRLGAASLWWLHHALAALDQDLAALGARLVLRRGPAGDAIRALVREVDAGAVYWNRRYDAAGIAIDSALKTELKAGGCEVKSFHANVLFEPQAIRTQTGGPFRVFTPFWRAARASGTPRRPQPAPAAIAGFDGAIASDALEDWCLLPTAPDWAGGLRAEWTPGAAGAQSRLARFIAEGLPRYAEERDRPDLPVTSRLSPYLRFGEISPFEVWHAVAPLALTGDIGHAHVEKFLAEVGWREFAHHLLHHFPALATANFQPAFDAFPWQHDESFLAAWRKGLTGYPIIDAGMRELWATGWMHNRVRMIVASFLVKHGLQDWRAGEAWFWDTLVDACPANNAASWQWVAGSGADAAPYFRIFNPLLQAAKFDPEGAYVRRWVPELADLPAKWLHEPWKAPRSVLVAAGVTLGATYPTPIINLDAGRERALAAFATLKAHAA
jgi:deoxyribodipyrimidine photo-lyase